MEPQKTEPKNIVKKVVKWCGIVFLIFFVIRIGQCGLYVAQEAKKEQAVADQKKLADEKKVADFKAMAPQAHLDEAKRLGNGPLADKHLKEVPEDFSGKTALVASLKKERDAIAEAAKRAAKLKADKEKLKADAEKRKQLAEWKKQGVTIGMTAERVRLSSWGRPQSINRTTYASGEREQWVYGGHNYLYFVNGILTTIQN